MVKEEYIKDLIDRFDLAKKIRAENHEEHWDTLSRHAMPFLPVSFKSDDQEKLSRKSSTEETFDPTFSECCRKSASIMETLLTPHYRIWHKLRGISKRQLEKEESVFKDLSEKELEELLEKFNKTLFRYRYASFSNFEVAMADIYHSLMVYGNACMAVFEHTDDEDKVDGFSYKCMPLQEMYWEENFERKVDTVFHRFTLKPRQIASSNQWSIDELSSSTQEAIANGKDEDIAFIHIVYPKAKNHWNHPFEEEELDKKNEDYGFEGVFLEEKEKHFIRSGSYRRNPYIVTRLMLRPKDPYGYSYSSQAISTAMTIDKIKKLDLAMRDFLARPILLARDKFGGSGISRDIRKRKLRPGELYVGGLDDRGQPAMQVLQGLGMVNAYGDIVEREKQSIRSVFNITSLISEDDKTHRTVSEINEKIREKNMLVTPIVSRIQSDLLHPLIMRELDLGIFYDFFKNDFEDDDEYKDSDIRRFIETIEYESYLTLMQGSEEVSVVIQTVQTCASFYAQTQDLRFIEKLNPKGILDVVHESYNPSPKIFLSDEESEEVTNTRIERQKHEANMDKFMKVPGMVDSMNKAKDGMGI